MKRRAMAKCVRHIGAASVVTMAGAGFLPACAVAQDIGQRVRVTQEGSRMIGVVTQLSRDEFTIALSGGGSRQVARSEIDRLEQSLGTRNSAKYGLMTGAAFGVMVSIANATSACEPWFDLLCEDTPTGVAFLVAGAMTGLLGLVGAGVGALIKREVWETIPNSPTDGMSLNPFIDAWFDSDGRPVGGLGAAIRF